MRATAGIDPSLTGTGLWANGTGHRIEPKIASKATIRQKLERLLEIRSQMEQWILWNVPPDGLILMENYAFSQGTGAYSLGEMGGVLRTHLLQTGMSFGIVQPSQRATFVTGKNSKKAVVVSAASARSGRAFDSDDECDAFILDCMAKEFLGQPHDLGELPKTHLKALDKIEWSCADV